MMSYAGRIISRIRIRKNENFDRMKNVARVSLPADFVRAFFRGWFCDANRSTNPRVCFFFFTNEIKDNIMS